jgi:hypothetical protein
VAFVLSFGLDVEDVRVFFLDKPKLVPKPIKAILIRKRYSTDNLQENSAKIARRELSKINTTTRLSLDNHVKANELAKVEEKKSPGQGKLRISDQLIKKLEDMDEDKEKTKSEETENKIDNKNETKEEESGDKSEEVVKADGEKATEEPKENDAEEKTATEELVENKDDNKSTEKSCEKEEAMVVEEGEKGEVTKDKVEVDGANIRNVIHSSLVEEEEADAKEKEKR